MAVNPEPAPQAQPATVPNTAMDPVRKWTGIALLASGLTLLMLAAIIMMFPAIGGNAAPGVQYGPLLFMTGVGVIWDRQVPVLNLP